MPRWARHQSAEVITPTSAETPRAEWAVAPLAAYLAERELLLPARLLGSGHQPLAFVMAHGLQLLAPVVALLGLTPGQGWTAWIDRVTALAFGLTANHQTAQDGAVDENA